MSHGLLIGIFPNSTDPFWVQVEEAVRQQARQLPVDLVTISADGVAELPTPEQQLALIEELLALDLNALVGWWFPETMALPVLETGLPIVHLSETDVSHPLSISPRGLYAVGKMAAEYLARRLDGRGNVLVVGGLMRPHFQDDGRSRIAGVRSVMDAYPELDMIHLPSRWDESAFGAIQEGMRQLTRPLAGILGLSDPLALQAYNVGRSLGLVDETTVLVGINGDPLALSAIARGEMDATIETDPTMLGGRAADFALRAARREPLPLHYPFGFQLVTSENVAETAAKRLMAIATLPNRLVGVTHNDERLRMIQLGTSLDISRAIGFTREPHQLAQQIADLIRSRYDFDMAYLLRWKEESQALVVEQIGTTHGTPTILPIEQAGVLRQALLVNEAILIPNTQRSLRYAPDPSWPQTRTRAVLPIRVGDRLIGLLDLHSTSVSRHLGREKLVGLQALADQLGVAIHNANLYQQALELRTAVEKTDRLKTRLLTNIGYELGAPLASIVDRSGRLLGASTGASGQQPESIRENPQQSLQAIHDTASYLMQLTNDLINLSQIENDDLSLAPRLIAPHVLLNNLYANYTRGINRLPAIECQLTLAERLPFINADAKRVQQIVMYLLMNAESRMKQGVITLGAEIAPSHLHIWVSDSGAPISPGDQECLFAPLTTFERAEVDHPALQLFPRQWGLAIAHRLAVLHRGALTVENQPERGVTFHLFLPWPDLLDQAAQLPSRVSVALLASADEKAAPDIAAFFQRYAITERRVASYSGLEQGERLALIVWDNVQGNLETCSLLAAMRNDAHLRNIPFLLFPSLAGAAPATEVIDETLTAALAARSGLRAAGPILIADGDVESSRFYRYIFEHYIPFSAIHAVASTDATLSWLSSHSPSLAILDLDLPGSVASSLLQVIRASVRQNTPVFAHATDRLTYTDVEQLMGASAVFLYHKDILTAAETANILLKAIFDPEMTPCHTSAIVKHAVFLVQERFCEPISRAELADAIGVSESYLSQVFRQELGISLWEYLNRYRIRKAKELLRQTAQSMTAIAAAVGISDSGYFSRLFHKQVGMSPSAYRVASFSDKISLS